MKRAGLQLMILALLSVPAVGQQAQQPAAENPQVAATNLKEKVDAPTPSDMYCSGFISESAVPQAMHILGGLESPNETHFNNGDLLYVGGGAPETGSRLHILREVKDPNVYEAFPGQRKVVGSMGHVYQEVGILKVGERRGNASLATIELACDAILPDDIVVPLQERAAPQFKNYPRLDPVSPPNGNLTGRIVAGQNFDVLASRGNKVYLNIGEKQGVKAGDYFRVTRTYESQKKDPVDALSFKASVQDPVFKNTPNYDSNHVGEMPRRTLGDLIVLYTTPNSSTAMIMSSLDSIQMGDMVELMEPPPPPPPPPPAPVMNPPTISCAASPATVRAGETASIRCQAESPDERALEFNWSSDKGNVQGRGQNAVLDTTNAAPGVATVTTTVSDDRNMTATATTAVTIAPPPPAPEASRMGEFAFRRNSAYVNNQAKAFLDQVALRLNQEANSTLVLAGGSANNEASRLDLTRANNAKRYLVTEKGIDENRITTVDAGKSGMKVETWFVPAGAAAPSITPMAAPPMSRPVMKKPAPKKPQAKPQATTQQPQPKPAGKP